MYARRNLSVALGAALALAALTASAIADEQLLTLGETLSDSDLAQARAGDAAIAISSQSANQEAIQIIAGDANNGDVNAGAGAIAHNRFSVININTGSNAQLQGQIIMQVNIVD